MANASLVVQLRAQVGDFMSEFEKATTQSQKFERQFKSTAAAVAGAFGIGFSVAGLTHFAISLAAAASNIVDLSKKLGISTDAVQRFQFIANQTGTTVEVMSKAMFVLGNAIAGDDQSAAAGLDKLGLSLSNLAAMNPEDRFNAVAIAAGKIGDVTERNAILTQIFGSRTAQELAKAVDEWEDLGRKATIAGRESVQAMADAEDAAVAAKDAFIAAAVQGIGQLILKWGEFQTLVRGSTGWLRETERAIGGWGQALADLVFGPESSLWGSGGLPTAPGAPPPMAMPERIPPGLRVGTADYKALEDELNESIKKTNRSMDEAAAKANAYLESVRALAHELSGAGLTDDVRKLEGAFHLLTEEQLRSIDVQRRVGEAAEKLRQDGARLSPELQTLAVRTEAFATWLNDLPGQMGRWATSFDTLRTTLQPAQVALDDVGESLAQIRLQRGDAFVEMRDAIGGTLVPLASLDTALQQIKEAQGTLGDALKEDLERVPMILRNAVVSGDWLGAAMEIGTNIGATIGQGIGTAIGGKAGGLIGEAIGSLVGPLIGKIFGDTEYEKRMKAARDEFKELRLELLATEGGLERLGHQFSIVGIELDSILQSRDPTWMREMLDEGYAKTQLLNEAMQEYGFTWENLGAEGRALQLGDLLTDLKAKTDILIGAGIDQKEVLQKQAGAYSDLVAKAVQTNTEIDSSMRPVLQQLVDMHLLVNENGVAFQDLEQVTWATSLTQGFDQVTDAIHELTRALTQGVGGALDNLGRKSVRIPIGFDVENLPPRVPALASGGIVRRPTLALVGESGPEAVIPLSSMGGAGGGDQTIILEMDGRAVARVVVPLIPGEVKRYGLVS